MRLAVSTIALLASASFANAADLNGSYEYGGSTKDGLLIAATPVWSGLYVGGHAGYGWGTIDGRQFFCNSDCREGRGELVMSTLEHSDVDIDGAFGGGQIGLNFQHGSIVFGVEGDFSWSDIDGRANGTTEVWSGSNRHHKTWDFELEHFGTVRGRLGLARDSALFYVTGGFAWGKVSSNLTAIQDYVDDNIPDLVSGKASWDDTLTGWTIGGGLEWMLAPSLTLKAEYLYVDLGSFRINYIGRDLRTDPPGTWKGESFDGDMDFHTIRVGLNYKFNR